MCRLAYIPDAGILTKEVLVNLLNFLEEKNGGHGNGIGGFIKELPIVIKGVNITTDILADLMIRRGWTNGVIFHTRMASKGSVNDDNCHPFRYNGHITCHNGHWGNANEAKWHILFNGLMDGKKLRDCTDSEIISCLIGKFGFETIVGMIDTGVILTIARDKVIVSANGDFEAIRIGDKWLYASEFPDDFKSDEHKRFKHGTLAILRLNGYEVLEGEVVNWEKPTFQFNGKQLWEYGPYWCNTDKSWWEREDKDNKKGKKWYRNIHGC